MATKPCGATQNEKMSQCQKWSWSECHAEAFKAGVRGALAEVQSFSMLFASISDGNDSRREALITRGSILHPPGHPFPLLRARVRVPATRPWAEVSGDLVLQGQWSAKASCTKLESAKIKDGPSDCMALGASLCYAFSANLLACAKLIWPGDVPVPGPESASASG